MHGMYSSFSRGPFRIASRGLLYPGPHSEPVSHTCTILTVYVLNYELFRFSSANIISVVSRR